ncbi:iron chelate uptake ABC transporter family permease subunit [Candidatus Micrarchaeota archaeon]|nr:iron chelate uptake ABC transporter family permease subunit [Candidatus Micrarchaeota archaeon]MBD3417821.1 iron chelate uptake ABC transporter family permease subunit [Candidatus Micrarchaeota archaeon]
MFEMLQYQFMQNAVIAAFLVSIACGIVGTYVVVKRIVALSGGIAHTAFGGIGLGYLLNFDPILTAIPWTILSALGIGTISRETGISEDTSIGMFWAVGMALGILFIYISSGYAPDLFSYLFGNILTVPSGELVLMGLMDVAIIIFAFFFYKKLEAVSFDEEFAKISGINTRFVYLLLLCMVALSVVVMIKAVGIILVIALLALPAAIARKYTSSLLSMMGYAIILSIILSLGGLYLSYLFDLPSGTTIILLLACAFLLSSVQQKVAMN